MLIEGYANGSDFEKSYRYLTKVILFYFCCSQGENNLGINPNLGKQDTDPVRVLQAAALEKVRHYTQSGLLIQR